MIAKYLIESLKVVRDDEMDRDDFDVFDGDTYLGVVKDEGDWGQSRGRWWAWSIKTGQRGFFTTRDDAVAAVALDNLPVGPAGKTEPGQRGQRDSMNIMSFADRSRVLTLAAELYDGTRTVAACWKEAFAIQWQERINASRIPEEHTLLMCVAEYGGQVHTAIVDHIETNGLDYVSPMCRTMDQNNRGTRYRLVAGEHVDLTCKHCLEYRRRRAARRAAR